MFKNEQNLLNQDISEWCVPLITSDPSIFLKVAHYVENKPIWGPSRAPEKLPRNEQIQGS